MIAADEDALTCDFAETYHVFNWRELPIDLAATLAFGLREDSRIKQKISGQTYTMDTLLTAVVADRLGDVLRFLTRGKAKPESTVKALVGSEKKKKTDHRTFSSLEEFRQAYREITGGGEEQCLQH